MARRIIERAAAREDVIQHGLTLFESSPETAERFVDSVLVTYRRLLRNPGIGHLRPTRAASLSGLRVAPVADFARMLVFYRPNEEGIEIVRVLHGARDIESLLEGN